MTTSISSELQNKIGSLSNLINSRAPDGTEQVRMISVDRLRPGEHQPRKSIPSNTLEEMADSIRTQGVIDPLIVFPCSDGHFEIESGERRWRSARIAGLTEVPCIIRIAAPDKRKVKALVANLHREDLCLPDQITAIEELMNALGSVRAVAQQIGKREQWVSARHVLAGAPSSVQEEITSGRVRDVEALLLLARHAKQDEAAAREAMASYQHGTPIREHIEATLGKPLLRASRGQGRASTTNHSQASRSIRQSIPKVGYRVRLTDDSSCSASGDSDLVLRTGDGKVIISVEAASALARLGKAVSQLKVRKVPPASLRQPVAHKPTKGNGHSTAATKSNRSSAPAQGQKKAGKRSR